MNNLTDKFLERVISCGNRNHPCSVENKVRSCLADTISVALAGAHALQEKERKLLFFLGDVGGVVAPVGLANKTSIYNAIFINGLSSHFLELDDGVRYGVIHPSAPLFSALLPVAKVCHVDWKRFLQAAIVGYETSIRLAHAMQPYHYIRGYHPTATCCTLGVSVAVAAMLGCELPEIKAALSAAAVSASGSLKVLEDSSELKPYNCGKAAASGYLSVMLARAGFKGPVDSLGGETGFLKMMSSEYNENILLAENDFLYVEKVYQKPYASCRHTHPGIEAAIVMHHECGLRRTDIERVVVRTYSGVLGKHDSRMIYGESSARMSIPYSVAVALLTGQAGIAQFAEPYIDDQDVLDLTQRVEVEGDAEFDKLVPDKRCALVTVWTTQGQKVSRRIDYPKGEPENPLAAEEHYAKFASMCAYAGRSGASTKELYDKIMFAEVPQIEGLD